MPKIIARRSIGKQICAMNSNSINVNDQFQSGKWGARGFKLIVRGLSETRWIGVVGLIACAAER